MNLFVQHHNAIRSITLARTVIELGDSLASKFLVEVIVLHHNGLLLSGPFGSWFGRRCFERASPPHRFPSRFVKVFGDLNQIWHRVDPEHELHAIIVPAIEVLRQCEVRVASQDNFAKARRATTLHGKVEVERRVFMARPVATAVGNEQWLAGVRQSDDQRMVPPLTFVVDSDALLLFGRGFDLRPIAFDDRTVEKLAGLL